MRLIDSPSDPTSPQSSLVGVQSPLSPARSLRPRYLQMTSSKSIDLDLNPINRLRKLSSFGSDSFVYGSHTSQGEEKKISQIYETKLKRLQQKVSFVVTSVYVLIQVHTGYRSDQIVQRERERDRTQVTILAEQIPYYIPNSQELSDFRYVS